VRSHRVCSSHCGLTDPNISANVDRTSKLQLSPTLFRTPRVIGSIDLHC
jgi:hypothetical protein